jgi:predicted dehydrogenase
VKSGPGFQKADGSRLVMVMRRDAAKAADYARRHGVPRWTADADALIRDPEVDAVYVATPPGSHCDYALRTCAAGKPCYVEKPMARNAPECARMVKAFADAGLPLFVAYYRRRLPRFLKAKELLDQGALGRVTGVDYRQSAPGHAAPPDRERPWRLTAEHNGGGLFLDVGCHTLDVLDFLLGPLEGVEGSAANLATDADVEDAVAMSFRTASGAPGAALWNFATAAREDVIRIAGTEGRLCLSTYGQEPVRLETREGAREFDLPNPPHVAQPLIQSVVDDLLGRGACPSTGDSAARTARAMDRVLDGYYGGRADEFWLRPKTWPGRRR